MTQLAVGSPASIRTFLRQGMHHVMRTGEPSFTAHQSEDDESASSSSDDDYHSPNDDDHNVDNDNLANTTQQTEEIEIEMEMSDISDGENLNGTEEANSVPENYDNGGRPTRGGPSRRRGGLAPPRDSHLLSPGVSIRNESTPIRHSQTRSPNARGTRGFRQTRGSRQTRGARRIRGARRTRGTENAESTRGVLISRDNGRTRGIGVALGVEVARGTASRRRSST